MKENNENNDEIMKAKIISENENVKNNEMIIRMNDNNDENEKWR